MKKNTCLLSYLRFYFLILHNIIWQNRWQKGCDLALLMTI